MVGRTEHTVSGGVGRTYGWVTQRALGNSLEERRLSDVGQANNTGLEGVSWAAEEDLLLLNSLLWWHLFAGAFGVATGLSG